jgi:hypothetical protein
MISLLNQLQFEIITVSIKNKKYFYELYGSEKIIIYEYLPGPKYRNTNTDLRETYLGQLIPDPVIKRS